MPFTFKRIIISSVQWRALYKRNELHSGQPHELTPQSLHLERRNVVLQPDHIFFIESQIIISQIIRLPDDNQGTDNQNNAHSILKANQYFPIRSPNLFPENSFYDIYRIKTYDRHCRNRSRKKSQSSYDKQCSDHDSPCNLSGQINVHSQNFIKQRFRQISKPESNKKSQKAKNYRFGYKLPE